MAVLFGHQYSREQILSHVGDLLQVAGIRTMELRDGLENGVRIADVRTGSGLRFQVSLDRGMDISMADYKGTPLAFRSANGDVHPHRFEPEGSGWSRGFAGGLMTGCGMTNVGSPCIDDGETLGQHGRLSMLPASAVRQGLRWEGDACVMELSGEIREATPFRENLLLRRTIETRLGESVITLRDVVRNEGDGNTPLMMLYHVNAGWPMVGRRSKALPPGCPHGTPGCGRAHGTRGCRSLFGSCPRIPGTSVLSHVVRRCRWLCHGNDHGRAQRIGTLRPLPPGRTPLLH